MKQLTEEKVTKFVGEMVAECLRTGESMRAVRHPDGAPCWVHITATVSGWSWDNCDESGESECVFNAVWRAVTFGERQLEVAHRALCA